MIISRKRQRQPLAVYYYNSLRNPEISEFLRDAIDCKARIGIPQASGCLFSRRCANAKCQELSEGLGCDFQVTPRVSALRPSELAGCLACLSSAFALASAWWPRRLLIGHLAPHLPTRWGDPRLLHQRHLQTCAFSRQANSRSGLSN